MKKKVSLKFYSDFICPWCYLGKIRLQRVMEELKEEIECHVELMPYILYPHIKPEGAPKAEFANKTKPGMGRSLREEAKQESIEFNYKLIDRIPYSLEAHRLVWIVDDQALKYDLSTQIFYDYFEKGINIGDRKYLVDMAIKKGIKDSLLAQIDNADFG